MTDGTPFQPLDTLVSQKRKTKHHPPKRGQQAAPFPCPKLNTTIHDYNIFGIPAEYRIHW